MILSQNDYVSKHHIHQHLAVLGFELKSFLVIVDRLVVFLLALTGDAASVIRLR